MLKKVIGVVCACVMCASVANMFMVEAEETKTQQLMYGDINGDGARDLTDLSLLSLHLVGDQDFTDEQVALADVMYDGKVNIADLAHFKQYINKENVVLGKADDTNSNQVISADMFEFESIRMAINEISFEGVVIDSKEKFDEYAGKSDGYLEGLATRVNESENFFEDNIIFLHTKINYQSGSIRDTITSFEIDQKGKVTMNVEVYKPGTYTCDIGNWIMYAIASKDDFKNADLLDINVVYN
ncbi:MAG: hypothetical protein E7510_03155 [Ruminococcus sp.]|nr:hypothetical protein [Ruminococcus sp.]